MSSEKRFVVIGPARTGSTMVRSMLNALPGVICHGELYAINRLLGLSNKADIKLPQKKLLQMRMRDEKQFWNEIGFLPSNRCGLKILYNQLLAYTGQNILDYLRKNKNIRILHLWRRNLEARYYSEELLKYKFNNSSTKIDHQCDSKILFSENERMIKCGNIIYDLLAENPILSICYEDFVDSIDVRLNVLSFLDIPIDQIDNFSIPKKRMSFENDDVEVKFIDRKKNKGYIYF